MAWYAAHSIISIRPTRRSKGKVLVYENVILVEAKTDDEAREKAQKHAQAAIVEDQTLTIDGDPAISRFEGIRKLISVSNPWPLSQDGERPVDGTEITYSKFLLKDEGALINLTEGKEVLIEYLE